MYFCESRCKVSCFGGVVEPRSQYDTGHAVRKFSQFFLHSHGNICERYVW